MAVTRGTNSGFVTVAPSADPSSNWQSVEYAALVQGDTTPSACSVTEIGFWANGACEGQNMEVGIYSNSSGVPGSLLYVSRTNNAGTSDGWVKVSGLSGWDLAASTKYWIGVQLDLIDYTGAPSTGGASSGGQGNDVRTSQETLPDPFGGGTLNDSDGQYTIYALISVAATNTSINIGDTWKEISLMQINIGDTWKDVVGVAVNIGDTWKTVYGTP